MMEVTVVVTAQLVLDNAKKYIGVAKGTVAHHRIIDAYNQIKPLPMGYKVTYADDWCDAFVTHVADISGVGSMIGRECGVQRHIAIFKKKGIWVGRTFPKPGDIIVFDWEQNGWADHIGFVESIADNWVTTIEGNSNQRVQRNRFLWSDTRIVGYARPDYKIVAEVKKSIDELAKEVISGKWSSGQERINKLLAAGYDASLVQKKVNKILSSVDKGVDNGALPVMRYNGATLFEKHIKKIVELAKEYNILPSLLIVMLHFEGVWGESNVAKIDNNWGGMTWSDSYVGNPKIIKNKGSKRPTNEGGYYIKYSSVEDFFEDWAYLLRPGGNYKVSGISNFKQTVKGLFQEGGAKYNYAALGYTKYLERMVARKLAIDKENSGILDQLDSTFSNNTKKLKVKEEAYRWFTGEKIPDWIKDLEFELIEEKEVMQTIYLLGNDGISIGWIVKSDVT